MTRDEALAWHPKPAHVVAAMLYDERIAYEAERREAMNARGITEASVNRGPKRLLRDLLAELGPLKNPKPK